LPSHVIASNWSPTPGCAANACSAQALSSA
jgi:hypothetical protein